MSKRHVVDVQQIPGIDLDYRPSSYFWALVIKAARSSFSLCSDSKFR